MAIEENNRNTLTQLSKFKKFQSQISEDFTKQFSVLEKLLDEFTTGEVGKLIYSNRKVKSESHLCSETKKSIVAERKALDSNCKDNNDEFKVQLLAPQGTLGGRSF